MHHLAAGGAGSAVVGRPELHQPQRAVRAAHIQRQRGRPSGGGVPQRGQQGFGVIGGHGAGERALAAGPLLGHRPEHRAQPVVGGHRMRGGVPGEASGPAGRADRGRPYAQRFAVPGQGAVRRVTQLPGQRVGDACQPLPLGQQLGGVRGGRAQHGEHAVRRRAGRDGHVQGAELEGQAGRELGVAAHGLGRVGEDHLHAEPVRV